jgi:hypothetical protein
MTPASWESWGSSVRQESCRPPVFRCKGRSSAPPPDRARHAHARETRGGPPLLPGALQIRQPQPPPSRGRRFEFIAMVEAPGIEPGEWPSRCGSEKACPEPFTGASRLLDPSGSAEIYRSARRRGTWTAHERSPRASCAGRAVQPSGCAGNQRACRAPRQRRVRSQRPLKRRGLWKPPPTRRARRQLRAAQLRRRLAVDALRFGVVISHLPARPLLATSSSARNRFRSRRTCPLETGPPPPRTPT